MNPNFVYTGISKPEYGSFACDIVNRPFSSLGKFGVIFKVEADSSES